MLERLKACIKKNTRKLTIYYAVWLFPSTTLPYILLERYMNTGPDLLGMKLFPYIIVSVVVATLFIPMNRYIFGKKEI